MTKTLKLRSAPTLRLNTNLRIDRDNLVIRDVAAMQAGVEAIGHGCQADLKSLQMMAELGNQPRNGIRSRFGHPGASENTAGKKIAVARNFRVVDDTLRHDMHLLESARISPVFARDPIEYIFDIAERYPEELAESVVINAELVWTLPDGTELQVEERHVWAETIETDEAGRPLNALTPLPVIRPVAFYYVDVVNEGALTHDGLFEARMFDSLFGGTANAYAEEVFELIDRWREEYNIPIDRVPDKVHQVLSRYMNARRVMGTKRKFEERPAIAEDIEQVVAEEETAAVEEPVDIEEAEATAEATAQRLDEAEQTESSAEKSEGSVETVPAEQYHALEQRLAELEQRFERLARLAITNTQNIDRLSKDVRRIDGEPIVSSILTGLGEPRSMSARPAPPKALQQQVPGSVTGRTTEYVDFDSDPVAATLAAQLERQKTLR